MAYFLAPSLASLRAEINRAHPNRDKSSDGWVGDTAHAARKSDHNPDYSAGGIVRALDVDKDGIDTNRLLQVAIANPSTEYVIWNRGIYTRSNGFRRAAYNGSNPHDKHMHISIRHTAAAAAAKGWGYSGGAAPAPAPTGGQKNGTPDEVAIQVLKNHWGTGQDRINKLRAAGYDPADIQRRVNALVASGGIPKTQANGTPDEVAAQVLKNHWGTGEDRRSKLRAAGYDPDDIQRRVNALLAARPAPKPTQANGTPDEVAAQVLKNHWGTGADRRAKLQAAGYDPDDIQRRVNALLAGAPAPVAGKSVTDIAREVLAGQWGNNPTRGQRLQAAGYNPTAVQAEVNRLAGGGAAAQPVRLSDEAVARQVIAGQWGSGTERARRITAAGYNYEAVRAIVNRLMG